MYPEAPQVLGDRRLTAPEAGASTFGCEVDVLAAIGEASTPESLVSVGDKR